MAYKVMAYIVMALRVAFAAEIVEQVELEHEESLVPVLLCARLGLPVAECSNSPTATDVICR